MDTRGLDSGSAGRLYGRIGRGYELASMAESRARDQALTHLHIKPGDRILNAGCGTGRGSQVIESRLPNDASLYSLDLAPRMAALTHQRVTSPVLISNLTRLPFPPRCFSWIWSAFVLDLLPQQAIRSALLEFERALKPGGRLILLSMTEGVDRLSRVVISAWNAVYDLHPYLCAGCRPLKLIDQVARTDMTVEESRTVVQWGFPAQVVLCRRVRVREGGQLHAHA